MHLLRFDCVSAILYLLLFEGGKNTDDGFTMDNLYLLTVIQDALGLSKGSDLLGENGHLIPK